MEVSSSNIGQVQQLPPQPQQQRVVDRRAFEEDLGSQGQAQQAVEESRVTEESQSATADYTSLIREARAQQAPSVQTPAATNENGARSEAQDIQHVAIAAYQDNQESFERPTSSGELQPRVDAII